MSCRELDLKPGNANCFSAVPRWKWTLIASAFLLPISSTLLRTVVPESEQWGVVFVPILILTYLFSYFVVVVSVVYALRRKSQRGTGVWYGLIAVSYIAGMHVTIRIGESRYQREMDEFASRSDHLIVAIRNYTADLKEPPTELQDLVPDYVTEIPATGLRSYPTYEFVSGEQARQCGSNQWILHVEGVEVDRSSYGVIACYPNGNYPDRETDRFGGWAKLLSMPYYPNRTKKESPD